jgi:glycosyltransferase involved in cell wall biosynthesis
MSDVSIIVPTYNHSRYIRQAIDSALSQTLTSFEVIVVDDGSTDDTADALGCYGSRIRVVRQQNRGVAAARNKGAEIARGDLLAFLDADDIWIPRKLELQTRRFGGEHRLGLVHCGVEDINEEGRSICQRLDGLEGNVATELLLFNRSVILGGGSAMVIPRAVFEEVGGFDTRLSTSADWDLFYRIASRYDIGFVPEVLVRYRLHSTNMHGNVRAMEHDMLLGYEKAFAESSAALQGIRRRCYGNLHAVLAGSFFSAGEYAGFLRHAVKSVLFTPDNLSRFLAFPIRRLRRRNAAPTDSSSRDTLLGPAR